MYFGYNKDDERVDMSTKDTIVIAERMKIIGDMDLKKKRGKGIDTFQKKLTDLMIENV